VEISIVIWVFLDIPRQIAALHNTLLHRDIERLFSGKRRVRAGG
jgi:hypothetical protein